MLCAKHWFPIFNRLFTINALIHRSQTFSKRFHYRCFQSSLQCRVKVLEAFKLSRVQTRVMRADQIFRRHRNLFKDRHRRSRAIWTWEGDSDTVLQKAELLRLKMVNSLTKIHYPMGNPYIHYYLGQQDGRGMLVFKGSSSQRGYGQVGYGLGGLFRSLGKIAKPMIKSGAKALGNIALTSGVNLLGDVLAGKSVKQAARARALEGANAAKMQAIQRAQRYAQTGRGRGRSRSSRLSTKKRKASRTKRRAKKRKPSASATRRKPTKRARTSPRDIFG